MIRLIAGLGIAIVLLLVGGYTAFMGRSVHAPIVTTDVLEPLPISPRDVTVQIDGQEYTLVDGHAEKEIVEGSASRSVISLVSNEIQADVNGDSINDVILLLTKNDGGSGTFYYLAVALQNDGGYFGTNAFFLGDRISSPVIDVAHEIIKISFAEHASDESYTDEPTSNRTVYAILSNALLEPIELDGKKYLEGTLTYADDVWEFTECTGVRGRVLEESPSFAALQAIYTARSTDTGTVFMTAVADTVTQEDDGGAYDVVRILSVPTQGVCAETPSRTPDPVSPEVSTTTEGY
jgi:hypothetical protein